MTRLSVWLVAATVGLGGVHGWRLMTAGGAPSPRGSLSQHDLASALAGPSRPAGAGSGITPRVPLSTATQAAPSALRRDLFHARSPMDGPGTAPSDASVHLPQAADAALAPEPPAAVPPPPSPEQLARAALARVRLSGALTREGRTEAFVEHGDERVVVAPGDLVAGRFRVVALHSEAIDLQDVLTGVEARIGLNTP